MAEICLIIVPYLRSSARKAAEIVKNMECDAIFLNFPRNLQSIISDYVSGRISLSGMLSKIEAGRFLPEPLGAWLYLNEPILEALSRISEATKVYCYCDVDYYHMSFEVASKIACLTARASVTGKINVEEWMRVIKEHMSETLMFEAEIVGIKARGCCICLTGLSGWKMAKHLRSMGHQVRVRCVERLYIFKPLEILEALIEQSKLFPEEAERLIWRHVNFIRDYVLTSENLDEAYRKWVSSQRKLIIHHNQILKSAQI
jgi:hypothetical protein